MHPYSIILINPPLTVAEIYGKYSELAAFQPPIGLASLAAYLRASGFGAVRIIDANATQIGLRGILRQVRDQAPDLVGLYCNTANLHVVTPLTEALNQLPRRPRIVLGGPHPSVMPAETLAASAADFAVMGEGEETLLDLVRHLADGGRIWRPSTVWPGATRTVRRSSTRRGGASRTWTGFPFPPSTCCRRFRSTGSTCCTTNGGPT